MKDSRCFQPSKADFKPPSHFKGHHLLSDGTNADIFFYCMEAKKIGSNAPTCPLPARLQVGGKSQVTTFMQGKPIMCTVEGSGQCYDYSFSSDAWSPRFVLDLMRAAASETLLDENNW